jgi:hypothetical protein
MTQIEISSRPVEPVSTDKPVLMQTGSVTTQHKAPAHDLYSPLFPLHTTLQSQTLPTRKWFTSLPDPILPQPVAMKHQVHEASFDAHQMICHSNPASGPYQTLVVCLVSYLAFLNQFTPQPPMNRQVIISLEVDEHEHHTHYNNSLKEGKE